LQDDLVVANFATVQNRYWRKNKPVTNCDHKRKLK